MDPKINVMIVSFICFFYVFIVSRKNKEGVLSFILLGCFLVTPFLIVGNSVHKLIYFADISGLIAVFFFVKNWHKILRNLDVFDYVVFYLLLVAPLTSTILQFLFSSATHWQFSAAMLVRSGYSFCLYAIARYLCFYKLIDIENMISHGCLCFGIATAFGVIGYFSDFKTDILFDYTESITEWTGGYGGGVVGMWRGEYGGCAAILTSFLAAKILTSKTPEFVIKSLLIICFIFNCAAIGSRQGLIGCFISIVISCVLVLYTSNFQGRVASKVILLTFALMVFVSIVFLTSSDLSDWIVNRFDVFITGNDAVGQAINRDDRMHLIWEKILKQPFYYVIGSGMGNFSDYIEADPWVMTYVDSEMFWVLQEIGIFALLAYWGLLAGFFVKVFRLRGVNNWVISGACGFAVLGACLTWGHYHLLNFHSTHTQMATLGWILFGSLSGVADRWRMGEKVNVCGRGQLAIV